jgi:pimeloyl-ACP methyl ester carboxylesterase
MPASNEQYNHRIKIRDAGEIAYIDEGSGKKTLVFIHGLATYALCWKMNIEVLKKDFRCIAIDLPGNGMSQHGDFPYSINFFTETIAAFIRELKLEHVCLVGHSMGGQIAITMALKYPSLVKELVLCAPAGFETFTPFEATIYKSGIGFMDMFSSEENSLTETIKSSFYHYNRQADDMLGDLVHLIKAYPSNAYKKMIEACIHGMLHEPIFNSLSKIEQPALVIFGEHDALIPNRLIHATSSTRAVAKKGTEMLKSGKLVMVPSAGHFVQWEKAAEVNKAIRSFLSS